jgi:hypothetical protein
MEKHAAGNDRAAFDREALLQRRRMANEGKPLECSGCKQRYMISWCSVYGVILGYSRDGSAIIQNTWRCPVCRVDAGRGGAPAYPDDTGRHVSKRANPLSPKDYEDIKPLTDKERLCLLEIDSGASSRRG